METIYRAFDGKEFKSRAVCINYEQTASINAGDWVINTRWGSCPLAHFVGETKIDENGDKRIKVLAFDTFPVTGTKILYENGCCWYKLTKDFVKVTDVKMIKAAINQASNVKL